MSPPSYKCWNTQTVDKMHYEIDLHQFRALITSMTFPKNYFE